MKNSVPMIPSENMGELLLFQTDGQGPQLEVRLYNESVWLSLNQLADLLQVDKSGISRIFFPAGNCSAIQLLQFLQQLRLTAKPTKWNTLTLTLLFQ